MKTKILSVSCYPHNDQDEILLTKLLNQFISSLNHSFNITLNIQAHQTVALTPHIHDTIQDFLCLSHREKNCINIDNIIDLFEIMKNPSDKMLKILRSSYISDEKLFEFFENVKIRASSFMIKEVFHFISVKELKLQTGQGPWGVTKGTYPFSVAIEVKGYDEVIYHEFLHQLNLSDGYDEISKSSTCNDLCWMQYVPTRGKLLCEKHLFELKQFMDQIS